MMGHAVIEKSIGNIIWCITLFNVMLICDESNAKYRTEL